MFDVLLAARVFDVEIATVCQDIADVDAPGTVIFFAVVPPVEAWLELFKLHGLSFGVVLTPIG